MKNTLTTAFSHARTVAVLVALGLLAFTTHVFADAPHKDDSAQPRTAVDLDTGWRFVREDVAGADQQTFDDSQWQSINLPHTWNAEDGADGPKTKYYRGVGWYRRKLRLFPTLKDKSLFLQFDGAATVTDVYVNGKSVGEHRGNFAAFCFDVTDLLKFGQDNVIAVKVDNSHQADVAPLSGDFTVYGGLYRDARLLVLDPLSVTPLDSGGPGVYIKQSHVANDSASVEVTTLLRNAGVTPRKATVRCRITNAEGKETASKNADETVPATGTVSVVEPIDLRRPHLWNGVDDPYQYTVTVEIYDGKKLTDRVVQPLGLRYFRVDPNEGLILNGKHYALHGVNRHQDREGKGWALSVDDHQQDYDLIRQMGSTGIRLSHYQHAQEFYDLCDSGGLVVWAEIPLINNLNLTDAFAANARQQLTELIKQNYNHPSILFWSLFNELHFPSGDKNPQEWDQIVQLNALAHQLDPTRLTTAATSLGIEHPISFITDVIAVNRYYGWYGGKPETWADQLDAMHKKHPDRAIGVSEYGAGGSVNQHENFPPKQPKPGAKWHPEEWQDVVHEDAWNAMRTRPWIWGTFLWAMYDFGSDGRDEGDAPGRNDKGMVTYDRALGKDAYFFYQASWVDPKKTPVVHIVSSRFEPRPSGPVTVKVYSNCNTVDLTVNGVDLGRKTAPDHVFVWDAVVLKVGENAVLAIGEGPDKVKKTDTCRWTGVMAGEGASATGAPTTQKTP